MATPLIKHKTNVPFAVMLVLGLAVHLFLPLQWGDDAVFVHQTQEAGFSSFVAHSARPLVDALLYGFISVPFLWRLCNPFVLVLFMWVCAKLFGCSDKRASVITVCCMAIYPAMVVVDAGFVATTLNYLWPVSFGFACFLPLYNEWNGLSSSPLLKIALIPALLFATDMQQLCAVMLLVFGAGVWALWRKRKKCGYVLLQFLLTCGCCAFSLLRNTTGDNPRMTREIARFYPDFASLNVFQKAEQGFSSTFYCFVGEVQFAFAAFLAFSLFLAVMTFYKKKSVLVKITAAVPASCGILAGLTALFPSAFGGLHSAVFGELKNVLMENAVYVFSPLADGLFLLLFLCIAVTIWSLVDDKKRRVSAEISLCVGLGTRMIMGFSPTVWASGYRTFFLMFVSWMAIVVWILGSDPAETKKE